MKKIATFFLTLLGLNFGSACSGQNYESQNVKEFGELIKRNNVLLLDVRTASEFAESHIADAVNIDVNGNDFIKKALERLDKQFTIAVYCRSGRRSANAANQLAKEGFKVVNLTGGINAWTDAQMPVSTQKLEWDAFTTKNGKTLKIYSLIHASLRFVYADKEIQIDPVGKMGDRITDYAQMPKANWIVVTHEHGDHLDKAAIETLSDANTRLITNQRCVDILGKGIMMKNGDKRDESLGDVMKNGDKRDESLRDVMKNGDKRDESLRDVMKNGDKRDESLGDEQFTLEAVPAYNITEGHTQFHPKGRDNGYIFTMDGLRIYVAGDTEDIEEMSNIKNIDIAFLPCNQPYTMTTEQLIKAARIIRPKILFPYHYGQTDVSGIPAALQSDGIEVRIRETLR